LVAAPRISSPCVWRARTKLALRGLCLVFSSTLAFGCRSLDRFDTSGDPSFCGDVVSGPSFTDGFLPTGEPPELRLKLELDSRSLSRYSDDVTGLPGTLTTNDAVNGLCSADEQALFESAPLRAIPQIYHDALATLSFGEGHDEDFFAWVDSTCQGTMLALVSLLRSGDVEVRLFKPASLPDPAAGPDKRPGFALFFLKRHRDGCGF